MDNTYDNMIYAAFEDIIETTKDCAIPAFTIHGTMGNTNDVTIEKTIVGINDLTMDRHLNNNHNLKHN
jgi:hypothetical protein